MEGCLSLRETPNFHQAFIEVKGHFSRSKVVEIQCLPQEITIFRAIEILVDDGFHSSCYQGLLREPLFRNAIRRGCSESTAGFSKEVAVSPDIAPLAILYDSSIYFAADQAILRQPLEPLVTACIALLRKYIHWWLDSNDQQSSAQKAREEIKELKDWLFDSKPEVHDGNSSEEDTSDHEIASAVDHAWLQEVYRFNLLLRALYFSILFVGRHPSGIHLLRHICTHNPKECPDFLGHDLWLQRIAALKLYDLIGFDQFIQYHKEFRKMLFQYVVVMREMTPEQHRRLESVFNQDRPEPMTARLMAFLTEDG